MQYSRQQGEESQESSILENLSAHSVEGSQDCDSIDVVGGQRCCIYVVLYLLRIQAIRARAKDDQRRVKCL